jgi:hypothetical protein
MFRAAQNVGTRQGVNVLSVVPQVTLIMAYKRYGSSDRNWSIGVDVAKTAIAGDHIRHAFLDGPIAAVPIHVAHAEIYDGTPGRVPGRVARGRAKH